MPLIRTAQPTAVPSDREDAAAGLHAPDPALRRAAVRALATRDGADAVLAAALARETEPSVLSAMLAALAASARPVAVEALLACLRSEDAWLRGGAIDALRALPEALAPYLAGLLADADPDVRTLAIGLLDSAHPGDAEALLLDLIERERQVNVCAAALEVLATIASGASIAPLEALGARLGGEPFLAFAIDLALARARAEAAA